MKVDLNVEVDHTTVLLGDIAKFECTDKELVHCVTRMCFFQFEKEKRIVKSVLDIIKCIHAKYPDIQIENVGCPDFIITKTEKKTKKSIQDILKIVFISSITFIGAAFSIMAFNNDVNITNLFYKINFMLTGRRNEGIQIIQYGYSFGIMAGILIFFHHFKRRGKTDDPTPMEIEMRRYEKDIDNTLIDEKARRKGKKDVD